MSWREEKSLLNKVAYFIAEWLTIEGFVTNVVDRIGGGGIIATFGFLISLLLSGLFFTPMMDRLQMDQTLRQIPVDSVKYIASDKTYHLKIDQMEISDQYIPDREDNKEIRYYHAFEKGNENDSIFLVWKSRWPEKSVSDIMTSLDAPFQGKVYKLNDSKIIQLFWKRYALHPYRRVMVLDPAFDFQADKLKSVVYFSASLVILLISGIYLARQIVRYLNRKSSNYGSGSTPPPKNVTVLLDNGHGGLINGKYQTPGKRSPKWSDGSQLFEGEFNRAIVNGIIDELTRLGIKYVNIAPEYRDVTLETRMARANEYSSRTSFYVSVHSNAGGGKGSEIFTSPGSTKSDKIATVFGEEYQKVFPREALRTDFSDGDLDKERLFYVLRKTRMPAILTENFFMDNERECRQILMTKRGRDKIVQYHVQAIIRVYKELY